MKFNKKLLASSMALGLAGITTVGSTYAWFTSNGSVAVTGISMTAQTATSGIYVAKLTDKAWSNKVDFTSEYTNISLAPCTSINGTDFYSLKGCVKHEKALTDTPSTFEYEDLTIANHAIATGTANQYYYKEEVLFVAVSADTRKLTVYPTIESDTDAGSSAFRYSISINGGATKSVYCPDASKHISADNALNAYNVLNGLDNTTYNKITSKASGLTTDAPDYVKGFTGNNNFDAETYKETEITTFHTFADGVTAANGSPDLQITKTGTADDYSYVYVTVGFWLEGNDTECRNAVAGSKLTASFSFVGE